jgi:hypothetical protein
MSEFVTRVLDYLEEIRIDIDYHTDSYIMICDNLTLCQLGRIYEHFKNMYDIRIEFCGAGLQNSYKIYDHTPS